MEKRVPESKWKWFGNAGHFICARWCQFHLCTRVGDYLISTVGQYWPERSSREIHARVTDARWLAENIALKGDSFDAAYMKRFGYEEIGCDRKFETMVFAAGAPCREPKCDCGLPSISGAELDFDSYNEAGAATAGHMLMCNKWANGAPPEVQP